MSTDSVSEFRKECEDVSARFADYPAEFLEWLGIEGYEVVREALQKRKTPRKVLDLLDAALMMMLAAEQRKRGKMDALMGMSVAETLPGMTRDMVALNGGWVG